MNFSDSACSLATVLFIVASALFLKAFISESTPPSNLFLAAFTLSIPSFWKPRFACASFLFNSPLAVALISLSFESKSRSAFILSVYNLPLSSFSVEAFVSLILALRALLDASFALFSFALSSFAALVFAAFSLASNSGLSLNSLVILVVASFKTLSESS